MRYSERGSYVEFLLGGFRNPSLPPAWEERRPDLFTHEWHRRKQRRNIEHALHQKLSVGELLASAIAEHADRREIIELSLWDIVQIDYEFGEIAGSGRTYRRPEIFTPNAIPLNVRDVPDWVWGLPGAFSAEANYQHVMFRGERVKLGKKSAKVVEVLHLATLTNNPWCEGKTLLEAASSSSSNIRELMDDKMDLVESDGRGLYRLNIYRA